MVPVTLYKVPGVCALRTLPNSCNNPQQEFLMACRSRLKTAAHDR